MYGRGFASPFLHARCCPSACSGLPLLIFKLWILKSLPVLLLQELELAAAARALSAPSGASCVGQKQGLKGVLVSLCVGCPEGGGVFLFYFSPTATHVL